MMHADGILRLKLMEIVHLIIFKLGDTSFTVRSMALDMMPVLAEKRPGAVCVWSTCPSPRYLLAITRHIQTSTNRNVNTSRQRIR